MSEVIDPHEVRAAGEPGKVPPSESPARTGGFKQIGIGRFSGIVAFVAMLVLFSLWVPESFLTSSTWSTIAGSNAIIALLALGLLVSLAAGAYDLSFAQNAGFSAIVVGLLMTQGPQLGVVPAILVTLVIGTLVGAFNGCLVGFLGVDSFIATLGTVALLQGGAAFISSGEYVGPFSSSFTAITGQSFFGVPIMFVYALIGAVIVWYALEHTPLGRRCFASGANPDAARLAGIRTRRFVIGGLVFSGAMASLAGVLLASSLNSVNQNIGPQYMLPVFAAAFLGTTQFKLGRFNVWGTFLAVYLLGTGVQGLQLAGAEVWVTNVFNGAALIIAVIYARNLNQRRKRREVEASES